MSLKSNIWGPDRQPDLTRVFGEKYQFPLGLLNVICSTPLSTKLRSQEKYHSETERNAFSMDDLESASSVADVELNVESEDHHYTLASDMVDYQSVDFGTNCMISSIC